MVEDLKKLIVDGENAGDYQSGYLILNSGLHSLVNDLEFKDGDLEEVSLNWLTSAYVFANAIGNLLPSGKGIVVKLQNEMKDLWNRHGDDAVNIVVFCDGDEVKIEKTKDDFQGGEIIDVFIINDN